MQNFITQTFVQYTFHLLQSYVQSMLYRVQQHEVFLDRLHKHDVLCLLLIQE